jgi:ectoine hydroxylase-related dioxygenase (phytanoyl-CoA dioxygenase family)
MSIVRQVFAGAVQGLPHHTIDFSHPNESHGFRMESVYMNRGTKLALVAWIPLHDVPLHMGGLCVVRGSNSAESFGKIRSTYGAMDVEGSGISGDGSYTFDANELLPMGKRLEHHDNGFDVVVDDNPLVSTTFEAGDIVLMTVYTMYGFLTNKSNCWRVSCQSRWIMEGDDVGPDPRYIGADSPGLANWMNERDDATKYPKSMLEAKREWGLI